MINRFLAAEKLTVGDPAYRLLRLILISTDLQSSVHAMSKLVLSVSGPSGQVRVQTFLVQLSQKSKPKKSFSSKKFLTN